MKCSNKDCKHKNLKESDFYGQSDRSGKRSECKYCMREKALERFHEKQEERKMYEIA